MTARIFRPAKGATSSGHGRTKLWVLVFDQTEPRSIEPLMGWTSSSDMKQQVRMTFDTREEAVAYCENRGIAFRVDEPAPGRVRQGLSYSDNFKSTRLGQWTH